MTQLCRLHTLYTSIYVQALLGLCLGGTPSDEIYTRPNDIMDHGVLERGPTLFHNLFSISKCSIIVFHQQVFPTLGVTATFEKGDVAPVASVRVLSRLCTNWIVHLWRFSYGQRVELPTCQTGRNWRLSSLFLPYYNNFIDPIKVQIAFLGVCI